MNRTIRNLTLTEITKWFLIIADAVLTLFVFINIGNAQQVIATDTSVEYTEEELAAIMAIHGESELNVKNSLIQIEEIETFPAVSFTAMDVPDINSTFKAYMDYRKITNTQSPQYKLISLYGYADQYGFMRTEKDAEIDGGQDYYMIALGSYYGTEIGTKYRLTTDEGNIFYGILADCKADIHTNSTNQYTIASTPNIVEFLVDTRTLIHEVKYHGTANRYEPLSGKIVKIERIDFREC